MGKFDYIASQSTYNAKRLQLIFLQPSYQKQLHCHSYYIHSRNDVLEWVLIMFSIFNIVDTLHISNVKKNQLFYDMQFHPRWETGQCLIITCLKSQNN